ncbi:MAG: hypothetical protein ACI4QJ_02395 [Candidatus Spyradenecus sp.]
MAAPFGSTVSYATEARGTNPFKEFLEHQQQLVVLMATGGMLTSLTGATGIGQGATQAHEETWRTIVRRDAVTIATLLNRTVTDALLDRAFPGRPHLAQFDFETEPKPSAGEVFDLAAKAVQAGYQLDKAELEERTGYRLIEKAPSADYGWPVRAVGNTRSEPALIRQPSSVIRERSERELRALARSLQLDFGPAAEALETFLAAPCESEARALIARLPDLLPGDPQSAIILEQAIAEAYTTEAGKTVVKNSEGAAPTVSNSAHEPIRGGNPDNRGQFSKTPGAGQREGETKSHRDEYGTFDEAKLADDPRANRARAKSVLTHLLAKEGGSEPKALYRQDTGWIGIDYGAPGNKDNAFAGGHGLAHILAKHPEAKDSLVDTLLAGDCYKHHERDSKLYIVKGENMVVLSKHRTGRLLITDFIEDDPERLKARLARGKYHVKGEN